MLTRLQAGLVARRTFAGMADGVTGVRAAKLRSTQVLAFRVCLLFLTDVAGLDAWMSTWKLRSAVLVTNIGLIDLRADDVLGMAARERGSKSLGATYKHLAWNSLRA